MNPGIAEQLLAQRRDELLRSAGRKPSVGPSLGRGRFVGVLGRSLVRAGNCLLALASDPRPAPGRRLGVPG